MKLLSLIRSLLCQNLVFKVGKSKVERKVALRCLLSLFIASVTGFCFLLLKKCLRLLKTYIYRDIIVFA